MTAALLAACAVAAAAAATSGAAPARTAAAPWWIRAVGADRATPPGPGVPVAVVDTGIDMGLPLFSGRRDTIPLNSQRLTNRFQYHGSAISSLVVGTGDDGTGVLGVYPRARLLSWNAAASRGEVTLKEMAEGIDAVSARGRAVINLSVGGGFYSHDLEAAVLRAIARGSFVVASVSNERPIVTFMARPAGEPHVFTVASIGPGPKVSMFSSPMSGIDVAAPGENLKVAVPHSFDEAGVAVQSGTSYSAAIVSGLAAWVWTRRPELDNTQLFEVLRRSARHLGTPGPNLDTGYGVINVAAALRYPAPPRDPQEPNDDIDQVAAGPIVPAGRPFLVSPSKQRGSVTARIDGTKDPHDVYRVQIPARSALVLSSKVPAGARVRVWDSTTTSVDSVQEGNLARHQLATASRDGGPLVLRYANATSKPATVYVDVWMLQSRLAGAYTLDAAIEQD